MNTRNLFRLSLFVLLQILAVQAFAREVSGPSAAEMPLKGRVLAKGQGLVGATVRLLPALDRESGHFCNGETVPGELARTSSDRQGYFELKVKEAGFYRLVLEAEGYLGVVEELALLSPSRASLPPIEMVPARRLELRVFGPQGEKIEGARIRHFFKTIRRQEIGRLAPWPETTRTGQEGQASFLVPEGVDSVALIAAPGFPVAEVELSASTPGREVKLTAGREVLLETVDAKRQPLPAVAIAILTLGGRVLMPIACSAPDGRARVHVLPGQDSLYLFDLASRATVERLGEPAPDRSAGERATPQRVFLGDPVVVSSRVVDASSGENVPDAWVHVPGKRPVVTRSDRQGSFELTLPPFYTGPVHVYLMGYREAKVDSKELETRAIPLLGALRITGRVVGPDGDGFEGALVRATGGGAERRWQLETTTGKEGRFVLEEVAAEPNGEIQAYFSGRQSPVLAFDPRAQEGAPILLEIPPALRMKLRVVDTSGQPIAGAEVFAFPSEARHPLRLENKNLWRTLPELIELGVSDPEGRLGSDRLKAGFYQLGVLAEGFAPRLYNGLRVGPLEGAPAATTDESPEEEIVLQAAETTRGVVVDETGQAVEGAAIALLLPGRDRGTYRKDPPSTLSDVRGEFAVREWAAGQKALLRADKKGYVPAILPEIGIGRDQRWVLQLRRAGSLRGRVLAADSKIIEAWVSISPKKMSSDIGPANVFTDKDGSFFFEELAPGTHTLLVRGVPGFQMHQEEPIEIVAGRQLDVEIVLKRAAVVFGRVTRTDGEPARGAQVRIRPTKDGNFGFSASVQVDALGQYRIEDAAPGWVNVEVWLRNVPKKVIRQLEITEGRNELDFVLDQATASLSGQLQGPHGEPVAGAVLNLDPGRHKAVSRADGSLVLEGLDPGKYNITIIKEGYLFAAERIELKEGEHRHGVWQLSEATLTLEGGILGLAFEELDGVEVYAHNIDGGGSRKGIVSKGRFRIEDLGPGTWLLVAQLGKRVVERRVELAEGDSGREEALDFGRLARFRGQVVLDGQPVRHVYYVFSRLDQDLPIDSGDSFEGRLELWAPPGTYSLFLNHDGHVKTLTLEIVLGEPTKQVIDLAAP